MENDDSQFVAKFLADSLSALTMFVRDPAYADCLKVIARAVTASLRNGKKLLIAGNGGSAADAQHIAGEFVSRLMFDRAPLAAIALTTDTTGLTAISNDYGFDFVFERQMQALGHHGDVFLGISTSAKSSNIIRALARARAMGLTTIGFAGLRDGPMTGLCDLYLAAPSTETAVVQQVHIVAAHTICALVERAMFHQKAEG